MYNISRYSKTLELDKILNMLAEQASLEDAASLAVNITPSSDFNEVSNLLENTEDAYLLTAQFSAPSFGRAISVSPMLARAHAGAMLSMKDFLDLSETLRVIRSVKEWRENCSSDRTTTLDDLFSSLYPNKYFEDKICFCIKSEDEMNDNASSALASLRRKISSASANIRNRLESIIRDGTRNKYLQDAIITQRDGRFVVPVKSEYKNEIPGIVHDTSASGATLFVEPMSVVEVNNELRVLRAKEKEEVERILLELSAEASSFSDVICTSYDALVRLNLIFAKASLAYKLKCTVPTLNSDGHIKLKNARHPLIDSKRVVPINIELGSEFSSLIITGPNTGGKTVTLKTVGLLTLMTMCGLMIPVDDNSAISVFNNVLVDIGDEQSIEQSLSTFSSHMVNIIEILKVADSDSLVLVDELGGGTDPVEGAALAKAILTYLHMYGVKTVATTHYAELKTYALDTVGVENACCEFDINTLKPTYRLLIGVPGRSNAFAIAGILGMPNNIISNAKNNISEDNLRFERVVASLEKARYDAEKEQEEVHKLRIALASEKQKLDSRMKTVDAKCEKILEQASQKANIILDKARAETNSLLNSMEEIKKQLNNENAAQKLAAARQTAKRGIDSLENTIDPVQIREDDNYVLPRPLYKGDIVLMVDLNKQGSVEDVNQKNGKAYVTSGNLKLWVDTSNLRLVSEKVTSKLKNRNISTYKKIIDSRASMELDIRGNNVEEGLMELDRYIDNAVLSGLGSVTVIHGKGTGVLRKAVHSHLKKHPSVRTYRLGTFGEGESGVTIVEIKD